MDAADKLHDSSASSHFELENFGYLINHVRKICRSRTRAGGDHIVKFLSKHLAVLAE